MQERAFGFRGGVAALLAFLFVAALVAGSLRGEDFRHQLYREHKYKEAIAECTRRIDAGEGDVRDRAYSYWIRGAAEAALQKNKLAIADFDRAIELEPTADRYYSRGDLNQSSRKYGKALADYRTAAAMYRDHGEASNDWGFREHTAADANREARDLERMVFFLTLGVSAFLGYAISFLFRKPLVPELDKKSAVRSRIILIIFVTAFPYGLTRGLVALGLSARFLGLFDTTMGLVIGILTAVAVVLFAVLIPTMIRDKVRSLRKKAAAPVEAAAAAQTAQGGRAGSLCPRCETPIIRQGTMFCPKCGERLSRS